MGLDHSSLLPLQSCRRYALGEFLDEFVERHKNIGPVAVAEKELVV